MQVFVTDPEGGIMYRTHIEISRHPEAIHKYAWAGVLMQPYTEETEGKTVTVHHPVTYVRGLFRGSQLNWAV